MNWYLVTKMPTEEDLGGLSRFLHQQEIAHRVTEEGGTLCLWVLGEEAAKSIAEQFEQDNLWHRQFSRSYPPDKERYLTSHALAARFLALGVSIRRLPLTFTVMLLGVLGTMLVEIDREYQWLPWLTIQPFVFLGDRFGFYAIEAGLQKWQLWRLWTPIFLHFGLFHILFNALWVWEFGRRIESVQRISSYFLLIATVALVSNLAQYYWQGPSLFGGLSGVLYGLLGYIWMRQRFFPGQLQPLAPGIIGFMLFWLVLCMTGAVNLIIEGSVANAAHLGGLLTGMALGYAPVWLKRV